MSKTSSATTPESPGVLLNTSSPMIEIAQRYLKMGFTPVPVTYMGKAPTISNWQEYSPTTEDITKHFAVPCNIGLRLGRLLDVDLDCAEAIAVAPEFLPQTGRWQGRASNPRAHAFFIHVGDSPAPRTTQLRDLGRATLVELRAERSQTVIAPSIYETGEPILWQEEGEFGQVDGQRLLFCVKLIGAASLLIRHWPGEGQRHLAHLCLAGTLLKAGWSEEHVRRFMRVIAKQTSDEEVEARLRNVETTARRLAAGETVSGHRALADSGRQRSRRYSPEMARS